VSLEVFAQQFIASSAVETIDNQVSNIGMYLVWIQAYSPVPAELRVISRNSVTDLKPLHIIRES
jgi:hypothetical protein